jgi:hypothetical protein
MRRKGRAVGRKSRYAGRIRPTPNYPGCELGIPDGFTQKERELKHKYLEESDFITMRIAQEREKDRRSLPFDLDGIDEIQRRRTIRKFNSRKMSGKRV